MSLCQRKISSTKNSRLETDITKDTPLITNLDSERSENNLDSENFNNEFNQNKSLFFSLWVSNVKGSLTCTFHELPSWLQDNKDIFQGYRRPTFSYFKCAQSLFYLHNEFVNIWSHLIGAVLSIIFSFATYFYLMNHPIYSTLVNMDFIVFYCFMAGAIICLGLSSIFHTLCCHSEKVCANWNRCDYVGIVALIFGSICPVIYYGFYCNNILKIVYFTMITIFGFATTCVAVAHRFRKPEFRWFRTGLFIALGGSSIIPVLHAIILYGVHLSLDAISLKSIAITGTLYIVGALLYAARIPESLFPGSFDIWGSSHQIFHFCVVAAVSVHFYGVIQCMKYWHSVNHECKLSIEYMKSPVTDVTELFMNY